MASRDYEEFIDALNAHGVKYLIVGAHAVAFHARPRATKDLDIFLDHSRENAERILGALRDFFGGADPGYTIDDLTDPRWVLQLGVAPVRIDLLLELPGISSFAEAWDRRAEATFGEVTTFYLGLADLIRAKEAAGRPQDRADRGTLLRAQKRQPPSVEPSGEI